MITKKQALESNYFHANGCIREVGPRGGEKLHIEVWRRNGQTKTWSTRPDHFRVPVKFGMRHYGFITCGPYPVENALHFHVPEECPALKEAEDAAAGPLANMNVSVL